MKAIGSFIIILFIIGVCFIKCTSDRTKLMIYGATDSLIQSQIDKCNQRIAQEDSIQNEKLDSIVVKQFFYYVNIF